MNICYKLLSVGGTKNARVSEKFSVHKMPFMYNEK